MNDLHVSKYVDVQTHLGLVRVRYFMYSGNDKKEGVILCSLDDINKNSPIVRVQSSCLFSEAFWASDCDCAEQLKKSLSIILENRGILIYSYEEGRGLGLEQKINALRLQRALNVSTRRAFECLNVQPDPRTYEAPAAVLRYLLGDSPRIRLLSNNPTKKERLREYGVDVVELVGIVPDSLTDMQKKYLREKRDVLNHIISDDVFD